MPKYWVGTVETFQREYCVEALGEDAAKKLVSARFEISYKVYTDNNMIEDSAVMDIVGVEPCTEDERGTDA